MYFIFSKEIIVLRVIFVRISWWKRFSLILAHMKFEGENPNVNVSTSTMTLRSPYTPMCTQYMALFRMYLLVSDGFLINYNQSFF